MMQQHFESLVEGLEAKLMTTDPMRENAARKRLALEVARLGRRLYSGEETVAWCGVLAPFDLLGAMGITPCFVEFVGAMVASLEGAQFALGVAEEAGFANESCGYHRAISGATMAGLMPEPDLLIGTSMPCSGGVAVIENLAQHFGKELFVLHVPHRRDDHAVSYLADQIRAMTDFVASHTGRPLDEAAVSAALERTNRARSALIDVYRLAQHVPSPQRPRDLYNFAIVFSLLLGTEVGVEVAELYREEFARKVDSGIAGVPNEQLRLLWIQNRIQFKTDIERLLAEDHKAAVVIDELNDIPWDPIDFDHPFESLARRILSSSLCGEAVHRIETLRRLVQEYRVDGVINPCHWGCRQGTGARGLLEEGLKSVGVPVLNLEVDCVDARNFSEGQLRTRLEAFIELLQARKTAGINPVTVG